MVRRDVLKRIGGFEDYFRGMYEDQAFYAKICLRESVYVFDDCLDWYRQHPDSNCNVAAATGVALADRLRFLKWLSSYMAREGINHHEVWLALEEQLWLQQQPAWLPDTKPTRQLVRRVKKWLLRLNSVLALPRPNRRIN
jgi:hypothetical protein